MRAGGSCSNSGSPAARGFRCGHVPSESRSSRCPSRGGDIAALDGPAAEVYRRSPDEPWRVLRTRWRVAGDCPGARWRRGPCEQLFHQGNGTTIYRGDAYRPGYLGDAFIGDAGGNLVHRKKLRAPTTDDLLVGEGACRRTSNARDFWRAPDTWFRRSSSLGPDGCPLGSRHVPRDHRAPWSLPDALKSAGSGRGRDGRIWHPSRRVPGRSERWVIPGITASAWCLFRTWKRVASRTAARLILASRDAGRSRCCGVSRNLESTAGGCNP